MIMSAETARHFFGEGDPLGQTLSLPSSKTVQHRNATMALVGIISGVKYWGLNRPADNSIFRPFAQQPWPNVYLIARTEGDPNMLAPLLQRRIAHVDPAIAVSRVSPLDAVVLDAAGQPRLRTIVIAGLAILALALAAVGLYGVMSRSVACNARNEIGIRMALGAAWTDIVRMVVGEGHGFWPLPGVAVGSCVSVMPAAVCWRLSLWHYADRRGLVRLASGVLLFAFIASVRSRKAESCRSGGGLRGESQFPFPVSSSLPVSTRSPTPRLRRGPPWLREETANREPRPRNDSERNSEILIDARYGVWISLAAFLFVSDSVPQEKRDWIDPDTGHRIVRLTDDAGGSTLYFHDNAFSPEGDTLMFNTPNGIAVVDVAKIGTPDLKPEIVAQEPRRSYFARRTREIYFTTSERARRHRRQCGERRHEDDPRHAARARPDQRRRNAVGREERQCADPDGKYPRPPAAHGVPAVTADVSGQEDGGA